MKSIKILFIILASIFLYSCSVENPLPTRGENSFFARLNGEKYIPKDYQSFPYPTNHGIAAGKKDSTWIIVVDNRTDQRIYIYLHAVEQSGNYLIQQVEQEYPNQFPREPPTSVFIRESVSTFYFPEEEESPEYIKITDVQDSLLIGEFQKITLTDPENPTKKVLLTDGKFHINLTTLNKSNYP